MSHWLIKGWALPSAPSWCHTRSNNPGGHVSVAYPWGDCDVIVASAGWAAKELTCGAQQLFDQVQLAHFILGDLPDEVLEVVPSTWRIARAVRPLCGQWMGCPIPSLRGFAAPPRLARDRPRWCRSGSALTRSEEIGRGGMGVVYLARQVP